MTDDDVRYIANRVALIAFAFGVLSGFTLAVVLIISVALSCPV